MVKAKRNPSLPFNQSSPDAQPAAPTAHDTQTGIEICSFFWILTLDSLSPFQLMSTR